MTPPPYPPPPPPQQPPPAQGPRGTLVVTLQGNALSSNMITPKVTLNGFPVPCGNGDNPIPAPAGRTRVRVEAQWLRTYGQAEIDVDVHPGQAVQVFYAAPWHQFTTGSIGFEKQRRKGGVLFLGIMLVLLLFVFSVTLLPILL